MAGITVMGGGIFGLTLAWELARRGARVRLAERHRIGAGASGGLVGALAPHVPENWNATKAFQFEALLMAKRFWAEVARVGGRDPGYGRLGRVQPVADCALERAHARAAAAETLWQGQACWRICPADGLAGLVPVSPSGQVIIDDLSARLHPRRALAALAAAACACGAELVEGCETPGSGDTVVWATGHDGLAALSRALDRPLGTGVKGQALSLRFDAGTSAQIYCDGVHIVPHADGSVAIGSTTETAYSSPHAIDAQCDALHARAIALCPQLAGAAVIERWAGVRPRARSRAPLLGAWPGRPGQFVFNGGFKIGFALAPRLAQIMADLLLDGHDAIPPGFHLADQI